jgi:hypothetical protein
MASGSGSTESREQELHNLAKSTTNRISGEANHTYITLSLASIGTQAATMVYAMAKKPKSPMFRG